MWEQRETHAGASRIALMTGLACVVGIAVAGSGCAVMSAQPAATQRAAATPIDDRAITAAIMSRQAESSDLMSDGIVVETLYGVVLLTGVAESERQRAAAQRIAEQVAGVKAVHNKIVIQH